MARRFSSQRGAVRVVFGAGCVERIAAEIPALSVQRVLTVCTPRHKGEAEAIAARLGPRSAGVLAIAREHVPADVVAQARSGTERAEADAVLAFGGGSAIGLAKAVALAQSSVRVLAVPTTYSGSEMTPVYGITEGGEKRTGRDERVRPALVVYDPVLTRALPRAVAIASLWNAMAHAVEALWAAQADRATLLAAEEALRLLASSAARLASRGDAAAVDDDVYEDALEGAYLAGVVFADAGGGLHHKLCHVLGGRLGLPHAETHAVLLPHVVRFHREAAPVAMSAIARALGVVDAADGLERLARATGAPKSLAALGMARDAIDPVAETIMKTPDMQPRRLERAAIEELLDGAWRAGADRPAHPPLRAPTDIGSQPGLGSTHESEALPAALPRRQNAPRRAPYGLYPELLNGTPFTTRSAENSRVWMYRVRPSFSHGPFVALAPGRFAAPLEEVSPNRTRWRPMPLPSSATHVDFLDGLVTLGGAGEPTAGPGWAVHLYAANGDMKDRSFSNADGDLLVVPQQGTLEVRTELGWLRVAPGAILLVPRGLKFAVGIGDDGARGWVLEVYGRRLRLPERGPIGSNGLADARHFLAPVASYEDRPCAGGFQIVTKIGGRVYAAEQEHSPFDVVAWHGNHAPFSYDLSLFSAMGSVTWDHPDPSILTVLTAPLDDHGRAIADFVVFPGRWEVTEHSFRPPFMHRNAASEVNMVVRVAGAEAGYEPGCTFVSPLLTGHGVTAATYDAIASLPDDHVDPPRRIPDESLWAMFESALEFRSTAWARTTQLADPSFLGLFAGAKSRFDPSRR